jgi:predicted N-acetyltransferase YhbS
MSVTIRRMAESDIHPTGDVQQRAFPRQRECQLYVACNFRAYPRMQYFVAEQDGRIVGYILWTYKSGFRTEVVLELEQMAVDPDCQGQGIGKRLILESLPLVIEQMHEAGMRLRHVLVNTRVDNFAQKLYHDTLGAEIAATVTQLFSHDEVFMVARDFEESEHYRDMMSKWSKPSASVAATSAKAEARSD